MVGGGWRFERWDGEAVEAEMIQDRKLEKKLFTWLSSRGDGGDGTGENGSKTGKRSHEGHHGATILGQISVQTGHNSRKLGDSDCETTCSTNVPSSLKKAKIIVAATRCPEHAHFLGGTRVRTGEPKITQLVKTIELWWWWW